MTTSDAPGRTGRVYGFSLLVLVGLGYFVQGFRCFPWMAVNFHFKDVFKVDSGTLQFVQNTVNLPMVAKPIYGIVSDAVYIRGAHRIPYLIIGGLLQSISWAAIVLVPSVSSSLAMMAVFLALSNLGASIVEVANDALVAECGKRKISTGELQSLAWFSSAAGGLLGNLLGALALSRMDFKVMYTIFLVLLIAQVLKCFGTDEESLGLRSPHGSSGDNHKRDGVADLPKRRRNSIMSNGSDKYAGSQVIEDNDDDVWRSGSRVQTGTSGLGVGQRLVELFQLVKQGYILFPLIWFVASSAIVPNLTGTMFFYQTQFLKIDPMIVGLGKVVGQVSLMLGSVLYGRFLKSISLRKLIGSTQILLSLCMLFDIVLVNRINVQLGIPDEVWVLGGSAFVDAIGQFKALPFMVFLARLCPEGREGSLMAFLTSANCLAGIVSGYLGVTLASLLQLSSNNFDMLHMGISIQAVAALIPFLWISFIPEESTRQPGHAKSS